MDQRDVKIAALHAEVKNLRDYVNYLEDVVSSSDEDSKVIEILNRMNLGEKPEHIRMLIQQYLGGDDAMTV